ncbi:hypothetical protein KP509_21G033300 [Ceratopteris richardii]|uniref:Uncharacterized protein n=1 Tax=Ceratopteris richardii TaxID=49495 RepID=A0A8T2SAV6_CERRI|nr:hypothetical protein KP509_21G033300 [Ceratopteris richardii]
MVPGPPIGSYKSSIFLCWHNCTSSQSLACSLASIKVAGSLLQTSALDLRLSYGSTRFWLISSSQSRSTHLAVPTFSFLFQGLFSERVPLFAFVLLLRMSSPRSCTRSGVRKLGQHVALVPGIAPFPERLRTPRCRKEGQSLGEVDIVKLLADIEVTLDISTLLKCSPAYRKQFYNKYIKKPRKAREKKRQDKDVQGIIQSITTQIDSNAPAVTVEIKGYTVLGAQLDSGAAVNLMTEFMMKALGLNHMEETPMSLRMADQTQVKPSEELRPRTSKATFSILLGRPWLVQAECVHDWRTGFISIGPKSDQIQIQVSPPSSNKKKTIIVDEMEKKEKEKARQEIARARFSLNTDTYKNLLQDGFNL